MHSDGYKIHICKLSLCSSLFIVNFQNLSNLYRLDYKNLRRTRESEYRLNIIKNPKKGYDDDDEDDYKNSFSPVIHQKYFV